MKPIWFILFWLYALAITYPERSLENGFDPPTKAKDIVRISILTEEQANKLFTKLKNAPHIPYKYKIDGCYARATLMTELAEKDSIKMARVYLTGRLQVKESEDVKLRWGWHVAPIVYVQRKQGPPILMVFDPSLFDRPVTEGEWKRKMLDPSDNYQPKARNLYYGSRFQYNYRDYEYSRATRNEAAIETANAVAEKYLRLQNKSVQEQIDDFYQQKQQEQLQ